MDYIQVIGFTAAALITLANVPQAIKIIRTKSTKGISSWSYGILFFGNIAWLIYGIMKGDWPIIISNAISTLLCGVIWGIRIFSKQPENDFQS